MTTITVDKKQDYTVVRYVSDTPFVYRDHKFTKRFEGTAGERLVAAVDFIDEVPEPYRDYLTSYERTEYWTEEVDVDEWIQQIDTWDQLLAAAEEIGCTKDQLLAVGPEEWRRIPSNG